MRNNIIALITPAKFPGNAGDTANYSEIIKSLILEGLKVLLICPKGKPSKHSDKSYGHSSRLTITRIPYEPPRLEDFKKQSKFKLYLELLLFLVVESFAVSWTLKSKKIKYVYMRHSILTIHLPIILRLIGMKVIADGELITDSLSLQISPRLSKLIRVYEKRTINLYGYFKVSTHSQAENLVELGFSKEKIIVMPVSINIDEMPKFSMGSIPEHTFGYFGVLEQWQGVDILLKGFQILHKKIPNSVLYIIGEGSIKKKLKQIVYNGELVRSVIFVDGVPRETLWNDYFGKFRIVVIPRPKQNNSVDYILPIKLVESLAAGKPIIAVDLPVMREIPNHPILLVSSADPLSIANAMEMLSRDKTRLTEQSKAALDSAVNYDIKRNIKKLTSVLRDR